ncbi:YceI family protein [Gaetbulibacter aquiaggeris]|uniref:YceI family protein n=1 Tax=Gaetbulibacter aquiaggeris TaxID=1735373 RepID=A0ABW7MTW2_9FLAO
MKRLLFIIAFIGLNSFCQSKYITKTGAVGFEASVPSFEEVSANTNTVTSILNIESGEFATLILVKGFRFKNALMEEHFNENYAESDKYPKATFKGIIEDFSYDNISSQREFQLNGELYFHGKTKKLKNIKVTLIKNSEGIKLSGNFTVKSSDFDIVIPKIVSNKVSEMVNISFNFNLLPM